jgi:hypothetical protein
MFVASVSSGYCKSRSSVTHVAMCVGSGGGLSGSCARCDGTGPAWACEMPVALQVQSDCLGLGQEIRAMIGHVGFGSVRP